MRIVPYKAHHIFLLEVQAAQVSYAGNITQELAKSLETPRSYTATHHGEVMGCAGIVDIWDGRAICWALFAKGIGQHFMWVHRNTLMLLEACPTRRVEATVDVEFEQGHRWLWMLGFKLEAECMRGYRPDGGDSALYARIR